MLGKLKQTIAAGNGGGAKQQKREQPDMRLVVNVDSIHLEYHVLFSTIYSLTLRRHFNDLNQYEWVLFSQESASCAIIHEFR